MKMGVANTIIARSRAIVVVLSLLFAVVLSTSGFGRQINNLVDSLRIHAMSKKASDRIAIVEIDTKSLQEVHAWPWPRSIHGDLVRRLRADGVASISFDVDFSMPASDAKQDILFAQALGEPGAPVSLTALKVSDDIPNAELLPHALVTSSWIDNYGSSVSRAVTYGDIVKGKMRRSIASFASHSPDLPADGKVPVDWSIDPTTIPTYSYADILSGAIPAKMLKGRSIIVGATSPGMGDHWATPVDNTMYGVVIHALGANTLLNGPVHDVGSWPLLAVAVCLLGLATLARRQWQRTPLTLLAMGATVALQWIIEYKGNIVVGIDGAMGVYVTGILLMTATNTLSAIIRQITTDHATSLPNLQAMRLDTPDGMLTIAVRLRKHVDTTALLGLDAQVALLRRVYDRLDLAAFGRAIYQVDEHSFAWRTDQTIEEVYDVVEGLHALFSAGIQIGELTVDTSVTVGLCDEAGLGVERSVAAAMLAANRAAQRGLKWERYEKEDDADWKVSLLSEVDKAIENENLWVAYQPKFDLGTETVTGAEALIRWTHPTRGFIAPDRFIPILEEAGRIDRLTMFVLERAIADFSRLPDMKVAVNLSMRLLGKMPLVAPISELLDRYGMPASRLTLEITESATISNDGGIAELVALRNLGVTISIDDYGTGQSTLSYLKTLPATELKIDRSFVQAILNNRSDRTLVDSTIKLAHALDMTVVAEGVETQEILDALKAMECDIVQGYYKGRPVPLAEFVARPDVAGTVESLRKAS